MVAAMLGVGTMAVAQISPDQGERPDLQTLVETLVKEEGLVSLALSTHQKLDDGSIVSNSYISGVRRIGEMTPISGKDHWHIGSCTKAMTALLYGDILRQKEMSWETSVADIFKDHVDVIDPAWELLTMEEVFTHRAGIKDFGAGWMMQRMIDKQDLKTQRLESITTLLGVPPELPIGEFRYSNLGYILAGGAIEIMTKKPWEEAMQSGLPGHIMGSNKWGFGAPKGENPEGHRKPFFGKKPKPVGQLGIVTDNPPIFGPAGTVHASHEVWARFALAFLPGETAIGEDLKAKLLTPPEGEDYAFGWGVYEDAEHGLIYSHSGSNTMWLAQVMVLPEKNTVILATTNTPMEAASPAIRRAVKAAADSLE